MDFNILSSLRKLRLRKYSFSVIMFIHIWTAIPILFAFVILPSPCNSCAKVTTLEPSIHSKKCSREILNALGYCKYDDYRSVD